MIITHLFFDMHDVLVDSARLGQLYADNLGGILAQRYGQSPEQWAAAYRQIVADWDSYYSDLNLTGDDGMADLWEGLFRITRALFRLTGTPEPPKAELTQLARELPGLASRGDSLYPEVPEVLAQLDKAGLILGIISHSISAQICAALAPVMPHFKGLIWGADMAERFDKDVKRYQLAAIIARVPPENCLVIDDRLPPLLNARRAGMASVQICRRQASDPPGADFIYPDLRELVNLCRSAQHEA